MLRHTRDILENHLDQLHEQEVRLGLVHNANKKTPHITVSTIVEAARRDSFATYLRMHNLDRPDPPHNNDWYHSHDCAYLRSHGYLTKKGFGTLVIYIGIAQLADYLDNVPNKDPEIQWQELSITEARFLFARLCSDVGVRPRAFGQFVTMIAKATTGQRKNLTLFGGKKLDEPPPWCVCKQKWLKVRAKERELHYTKQAKRQGKVVAAHNLPPYGSRTAQARAPHSRKHSPPDTLIIAPLTKRRRFDKTPVVITDDESGHSGEHVIL
jgi:hypothetical protein